MHFAIIHNLSKGESSTNSNLFFVFSYRDWDRFAKTEYERLAMEEEGGDDSDVIDAMEGWDSEDADDTKDTKGSSDAS